MNLETVEAIKEVIPQLRQYSKDYQKMGELKVRYSDYLDMLNLMDELCDEVLENKKEKQ